MVLQSDIFFHSGIYPGVIRLFFWDLFVLGTRTLRKGGVMIRWLGLLGRYVGTSYHASFCCGRAVYSGCVLGTFDCVQLQFTLYYHDVAVVMIVIFLCVSCPSLVYSSILWGATPHIKQSP